MRWFRPWLFVAIPLLLSGPALAQVVWGSEFWQNKHPADGMPAIKARPDAWPRLDPGAVICKTEADLQLLAAFRRGESANRPNCQVIREPTPVQIVQRSGPGRTQVSITDQKDLEGWTDAYLPDKAPLLGGRSTTLR